jgi:hypothetical protein
MSVSLEQQTGALCPRSFVPRLCATQSLARLADAINAADTMLDGHRVPRNIVVNKRVAELEIASLPSGLRAQ